MNESSFGQRLLLIRATKQQSEVSHYCESHVSAYTSCNVTQAKVGRDALRTQCTVDVDVECIQRQGFSYVPSRQGRIHAHATSGCVLVLDKRVCLEFSHHYKGYNACEIDESQSEVFTIAVSNTPTQAQFDLIELYSHCHVRYACQLCEFQKHR